MKKIKNLDVPAWANDNHKKALERKAYEQRTKALERKQTFEGAITLAILIACVLINAWCNGHL